MYWLVFSLFALRPIGHVPASCGRKNQAVRERAARRQVHSAFTLKPLADKLETPLRQWAVQPRADLDFRRLVVFSSGL